jgi:hypothetical protein
MQPIDPQALSSVHGGFAALLGALPGILQGVGGIIAASKSGGSKGSAEPPPSAGPAQPAPAPAPAPSPSPAPAPSQSPCACCTQMIAMPVMMVPMG